MAPVCALFQSHKADPRRVTSPPPKRAGGCRLPPAAGDHRSLNHCKGSRQGVTERRVVEGSVKTEPRASTRAVSKRLGPSDRFDLLSTRSIQACTWSLQALSQKSPTSLTESALGLNPFVSDASALVLSTKRKTSCPCSKGAQVSSATGAAKISN